MPITDRKYVVAELWAGSGARFVHSTLRTLPEAILKVRALAQLNREIPATQAAVFEIFEMKGRYEISDIPSVVINEENPNLPPADASEELKYPAMKFPNQ